MEIVQRYDQSRRALWSWRLRSEYRCGHKRSQSKPCDFSREQSQPQPHSWLPEFAVRVRLRSTTVTAVGRVGRERSGSGTVAVSSGLGRSSGLGYERA